MRHYIQAIGQDSHPFSADPEKTLVLGGVIIDGTPGLAGNSDADVVLHALTNAISGLTCKPVLGAAADELCLAKGITDSAVYLEVALRDLADLAIQLHHVSFTVQAKRPRLLPHIPRIRHRIAELLQLSADQVMLTATTGEGLTAFGRGEGIEVFCIVSASKAAADAEI